MFAQTRIKVDSKLRTGEGHRAGMETSGIQSVSKACPMHPSSRSLRTSVLQRTQVGAMRPSAQLLWNQCSFPETQSRELQVPKEDSGWTVQVVPRAPATISLFQASPWRRETAAQEAGRDELRSRPAGADL